MYKDGVPLWDEKKLSTSGTNTTWSSQKPDVGIGDNGNAVVVCAAYPDGKQIRRHRRAEGEPERYGHQPPSARLRRR